MGSVTRAVCDLWNFILRIPVTPIPTLFLIKLSLLSTNHDDDDNSFQRSLHTDQSAGGGLRLALLLLLLLRPDLHVRGGGQRAQEKSGYIYKIRRTEISAYMSRSWMYHVLHLLRRHNGLLPSKEKPSEGLRVKGHGKMAPIFSLNLYGCDY